MVTAIVLTQHVSLGIFGCCHTFSLTKTCIAYHIVARRHDNPVASILCRTIL